MANRFHSIYTHGFIRTAVCIPKVRVADPGFNVDRTVALARRASELHAAIALFPELGLSAYSNDDLFHQDALLDAVCDALSLVVSESRELTPVLLVGAPLRLEGKLFNCAVVVFRGSVLGIVPKTYLPSYREFYEKRQFNSGRCFIGGTARIFEGEVPFGNDLVFEAAGIEDFAFHVEICEDLWAPIPPSTYAALSGATVLANLSASNITVGKAKYRHDLCAAQSGKCIAAYLYSAAGPGESTTDVAWDGHALIYENNELLTESERFPGEEQILTADIDLGRLIQDRMRSSTFNDAVLEHREKLRTMRRIAFDFRSPDGEVKLAREVPRFPFVPTNPKERDERCFEAYNIQVHGLMKRLESSGIERVVIGVSGGLDSTQAIIVAAKTMDRLGLPRENILAYTMPGYATSESTLRNARGLMCALGATPGEIDIRPASLQMLRDIGHPFAEGKPVYDVTFENVQAGERTSHLFRLANFRNALVVGTGDLSEIALGWATYGVGDHMSHYNVNASVPKTLIQYLIRWVIESEEIGPETGAILASILDTEISPELIPGGSDPEGPFQRTEEMIGPYALQDFNLYYITRYGFRPGKVAYLCLNAWRDKDKGSWPASLPPEKRNSYGIAEIKKWLEVFLFRFFKISQFKRSCMPNGPKVGSGGSLSPRGDWRAPSDSEAVVWLEELRRSVPDNGCGPA